jgi:hypothetical protein
MTTMAMAMAQRDTTTITMAMDVVVDDDECDDAILTMCNEGAHCNHDDSKDACALTATMPAHRRRQQHSHS